MNRFYTFFLGIMFITAMSCLYGQSIALYDDFEGNGIVAWNYYEDAGKPGIVEFRVSNPDKSGMNTSNNVAKFTKTSTSNPWMNSYIDVPAGFDLSAVNQFTILVYSSSLHQVKLKLQPGEDYNNAVEKTAMITATNTWQLLTFDFSSAASRTDFTKLNIHFNDGIAANGIYYFDLLNGPPLKPSISISDNGEIKRMHENGEVITVKLFFDTFVSVLNASNWSFYNLPEGVSVSQINRISDNQVNLVLAGNASENYSKSITDFIVSISNEELTTLSEGSLSATEGVIFDASYWKLIWSDEFDYTGLPDNSKWSFETMLPGTVNDELQNYVADRTENARVENGELTIECRKDNFNGYTYSSARLRTAEKGDWLYGKVVTRAKLPSGKGTWPAIWMLPTDWEYGGWPASGEIDIMEHVGYDPGNVHASIHSDSYNHTKGTQKTSTYMVSDFDTEYHQYTIDWKPENIEAYVDSTKYFSFVNENKTYKEWPFDKQFYLILNIAYGGSWGGAQGIDDAIFSRPEGVKMLVDYVRVYKNIEEMIISGPDSVFTNEKNISFSIDKIDGVEYTWLPSDNYTITSAIDSNIVTIDWGCNTDTLKVELLVDGTEMYTITKVISINPYKIDGDIWVDDQATDVLYTTNNIEGAVYNWSASEGISVSSGQGNDSVYFDFTQKGNIYLTIETSCGFQYDTLAIRFGDGQFPYPEGQEPYPIPGKIVAAYFDLGGEGVAYHDTDAGNNGAVLRNNEDVDIEQKDNSYTLGWTATGEWLEYNVNVEGPGVYTLAVRAGGQNGGKIRILQNGNIVADNITLPSTGSWDSFSTITITGIALENGISVLRIEFIQGGCNLGDMNFTVPSGISKQIKNSSINVFPNPAKDRINVSFSDRDITKENLDVKIYSIQGQMVIDTENHIGTSGNLEIDVSMLNKGMYLLTIEASDISFKQPVLIN